MAPDIVEGLSAAGVRLFAVGLAVVLAMAGYHMARLAVQDRGIRIGQVAGLFLIPLAIVGYLDYNRDRVTEPGDDPLRPTVEYSENEFPPKSDAERVEDAAFVFALLFVPAIAGLVRGRSNYMERSMLAAIRDEARRAGT